MNVLRKAVLRTLNRIDAWVLGHPRSLYPALRSVPVNDSVRADEDEWTWAGPGELT